MVIRKEIYWMVSNIAAGTLLQLETLVAKGYLKIMTNVLKEEQLNIKYEAVWAICNFSLVEKKELIESIFKDNIVETVCEIIKLNESKYVAVGLEALTNLLKIGKNMYMTIEGNPVAIKLQQLGIYDYLEQLQYHESEVVYEKAIALIEGYIEYEDNELI